MKKIIFTLFAFFMFMGATKATVIFDPESFDVSALPAGMSIVDTAGGLYLRVSLNGWNSMLTLPVPVEIPEGEIKFYFNSCYQKGDATFASNITNSFVQLVTSDYSVKYPAISASSAKFIQYSGNIPLPLTISILQFAGQETQGWTAVVGGILYVGKIVAAETVPPVLNVNITDQKSNLDIFPNPATKELFIQAQGLFAVELINLTGKVVLKSAVSGSNTSLNISNILPGIYMVKSYCIENTTVQKVIIK